jgi:transcriptional regulator with XRE-family HTH domain
MTPFGAKLRQLRLERGITLKAMAAALRISPAYLSALEHGHRGMPTWTLVQRVIVFFNVIWDEADELERLAQISNPRIVVDTAGLTPRATEFANRLAKQIGSLEETDLEKLLTLLPGDPRAQL